jgi:ribosome-associated toxin RatA of RatAB toxin-antitoxin module
MFYHKKILFFLFSIISVGFITFTSQENEWILKKQSNEVTVYSRGVDRSAIKELRAVTQIKTSLSSIIALLLDRESYPQWVYKCAKSHVLKEVNDAEAICYQNVVAPWPINNRDIILIVTVQQDEATKIVFLNSVSQPEYIPKVDNHVRVLEFKASWKLTPLQNGIVNCEYQLLFDPGGNIPSWIINIASVDGPFETTTNMRHMVMKEKYQQTHYTFIKEL